MNTTQIAIASGLAGFLAGSATVYFAVVLPSGKKVEARITDEREGLREYYESHLSEEAPVEENKTEEIIGDPCPIDKVSEMEVIVNNYKTVNGSTLEDSVAHPEDDDDEEEYELVYDHNPNPLSIEVVSEDVFEGDEWGYEYTQMNWFPVDDILSDSMDVPAENVEELVGDALERIGNKDIMWVINHNLKLRIEILTNLNTFQEHIYGIRNDKDPLYHKPRQEK